LSAIINRFSRFGVDKQRRDIHIDSGIHPRLIGFRGRTVSRIMDKYPCRYKVFEIWQQRPRFSSCIRSWGCHIRRCIGLYRLSNQTVHNGDTVFFTSAKMRRGIVSTNFSCTQNALNRLELTFTAHRTRRENSGNVRNISVRARR